MFHMVLVALRISLECLFQFSVSFSFFPMAFRFTIIVQGLSSRSLSDRACICFLGSGFHFSFFISGASHAHLLSSTGFFTFFHFVFFRMYFHYCFPSFLCSLAGLEAG